jgi:protein disulfide-isomerase A1
LATKFRVRGFPTLKFFTLGVPIDYDGGRISSEIIHWINRKTSDPISIVTEQNFTTFIESAKVVVIGYFEDPESESAKVFAHFAQTTDGISFGKTTDKSFLQDLKGSGVVLFKNFDEGKAVLEGDFDSERFKQFLNERAVSLVNEFDGSGKMFENPIKLHFFAFSTLAEQSKLVEVLRQVAENFRGKVLFSVVNVEAPTSERVCEYFSFNKDNTPAVMMFTLGEQGISNYRPPTNTIDVPSMNEFVSNVLEGKIPKYFKSEEPVEYEGKGVRTLVGKDHDSVTSDETKYVFVEYYAPWCGHCKKLAPIWDSLAEHYAGNSEVVIAKIDSTENEVQTVNIEGFPTLKMHTKENKIVDYVSERSFEELVKFVDSILDGTYTPPVPSEEDYEAQYGEGEGEEEEGEEDYGGEYEEDIEVVEDEDGDDDDEGMAEEDIEVTARPQKDEHDHDHGHDHDHDHDHEDL